MARNDLILLDSIVDEIVESQSAVRSEVFELFSFEQLLKFADLDQEDLRSGWVDGADDGGIDGFFVFVNGHLVTELDRFHWPKARAELELWLVTCKHQDSFVQAPIDKLIATLSELLDLSVESASLATRYSKPVLAARERLIQSYRRLATRMTSFAVNVAYVSRGDTSAIGRQVQTRANQLRKVVESYFSACAARFHFLGASELVRLHRKARKYSLELPYVECFNQGDQYVLLCRLSDYNRFIKDEDGVVRRYLFESNVRDFVGLNRVNEDIAASLAATGGPDFWWLNNGVTVLVTKAIRTGKSLVLDDVQIVNGLQTTESIARYFAGSPGEDDRSVLIKVIKTDDGVARDQIIRATNNQTEVEQQSLHATEKVQRDIEEVLLADGWFYDRRKNYYANQGAAPERVITPLFLAAAFVGVVLKDVRRASTLKQRFMRNVESYKEVFGERSDLRVWPKLAKLMRGADGALNLVRPGLDGFYPVSTDGLIKA